jgi:hypothetical protein
MNIRSIIQSVAFGAFLVLSLASSRAQAVVVVDMPPPPKKAVPAPNDDRAMNPNNARHSSAKNIESESTAYANSDSTTRDAGDLAFARYTRGRYYPTSRYGRSFYNPWYDPYYDYGWGWGWWGWGWPWFGCGNFVGVGTIESPTFSGPVNSVSHWRQWTQVRHSR